MRDKMIRCSAPTRPLGSKDAVGGTSAGSSAQQAGMVFEDQKYSYFSEGVISHNLN